MSPRRLLLSLAAALALQFAGCLDAPEAGEPLGDHGDPVLLTGRPVAWQEALNLGVAGYEPSLAVDDAGTLYVTAHKDLDRPLTWPGLGSPLLVSRDGGATWVAAASPLGIHHAFVGVEGDLAVDATGRLFFLDTYTADNHLHVFDDEGREWAYSVPAQRTVSADNRPWITAQGDGIVHYLGNNGVNVNGSRIWYYRSTDGGLTFTPGSPMPGGWAHIDAERHGERVHIAQEGFGTGAPGIITVTTSHDAGATWMEPQVAGWRDGFGRNSPVVAAADDGYAYILFNECGTEANCADGGGHMPNRLHVAVTWDGGGYWLQRDVTPDWNGFADYATICAAPGGRMGMAFYGTPDTPVTPESEWFLYGGIATDVDVDLRFRFNLTKADPAPVYVGDDLNALHDFLECAMTPDGDLAIAYQRTHGAHAADAERDLWFVRGGVD